MPRPPLFTPQQEAEIRQRNDIYLRAVEEHSFHALARDYGVTEKQMQIWLWRHCPSRRDAE